MLKTVHTWFNQKWDETGYSLEKIRNNILLKHSEASMSTSKLHRIFSDEKCKVDIEDMLMVSEGLDQDPNELLAIIGAKEYVDSKDVGYKGATALIADFERREINLHNTYKEQLEKEATLRRNIHQAFNDSKARFDYASEIFETHLTELREENKELVERVAKLETSRKTMFWGLLSALLAVIALFIVFIIIDAPRLALGGNKKSPACVGAQRGTEQQTHYQ